MELFEYNIDNENRINTYKSNFFHMYLDGYSPFNNFGFKNEIPKRDYASFIHEYVHYIQQITTPYGLKYSSFFNNSYILYREYIDSRDNIKIPLQINIINEHRNKAKEILTRRNGDRDYNKGSIGDIEIYQPDIEKAKKENTAVNIQVYDFENDRAFEKGFQFGYWCIIESMAHLVQSLANPELYHRTVPYEAVQLICRKIRPDLATDTKLLITICYISLYFDNPGYYFFEIIKNIRCGGECGIKLYQEFMRDYSRKYKDEEMPNYRMMHMMMDDFTTKLGALLGCELDYYQKVFENCKKESSRGDSLFLNIIYNENLDDYSTLSSLIDYYGYPAIDSCNSDIIVPFNPKTNIPHIETAVLISLELMISRFKKSDKVCVRYNKCNADRDNEAIEEYCVNKQWHKKKSCFFKNGLNYFRWQSKLFDEQY